MKSTLGLMSGLTSCQVCRCAGKFVELCEFGVCKPISAPVEDVKRMAVGAENEMDQHKKL